MASRRGRFYPTKEKAEEVIRSVRKEFAKQGRKTMQEALDAKPEAIAGARQRRVLTVLDGGGFASSP